jgi:hypothetical protein
MGTVGDTQRMSVARRWGAAALALATAAAVTTIVTAAPAAHAGPVCSSPPCPIELSFYKPASSTYSSQDQTLCDVNAAGVCINIDLKGWLYLPGGKSVSASGSGLPLVVFIHGSSTGFVSHMTEMARYFTAHGFAFFVLHRRGHGDSTGTNLDSPPCPGCTNLAKHLLELGYLSAQRFEVKKSISYLRTLKTGTGAALVNPSQVAFLGHSYGGIISLYANETDIGQKTAIDIAGASESWGAYDAEDGSNTPDSSISILQLEAVVSQHITPMMFLQPLNDCSTRPTVVLSKVIGDQNRRYDATLFPNVPVSPTTTTPCEDAHIGFVTLHAQVYSWGPVVNEWLHRQGVG